MEVLSLEPGKHVTLEIACSKTWTTYGDKPNSDACPNDAGSYHAGGTTGTESGWAGNDDQNLMGCALAIAFKSNPYDVQPEDFTVMSVQEQCVRQRDTVFAIPSNLPACPEGGCTCSWFWAGKNSAMEMYMVPFRCDVNGGAVTSDYPKPVEPRRNAISGPTQPFYFANDINNIGYEPEYATKPSYNAVWGWTGGAQEEAFSGLSGSNDPGSGSNGTMTKSATTSTWTATATHDSDAQPSSYWQDNMSDDEWHWSSTEASQITASPTWHELQASATVDSAACKRRKRNLHRRKAFRSRKHLK